MNRSTVLLPDLVDLTLICSSLWRPANDCKLRLKNIPQKYDRALRRDDQSGYNGVSSLRPNSVIKIYVICLGGNLGTLNYAINL